MSLLHQTEEDDALASGHADSGLRKSLKHILRTKKVLVDCLPFLPEELKEQACAVLRTSHYDEIDDGVWRLETKVEP